MLRLQTIRPNSGEPLRSDEDGASLLEMAIVAPFLLGIGLGIFEFGNALYKYHLITAGVRDAGRYLSGHPETDATATDNAKNIAVCGRISPCDDADDRRVSWWTPAHIDISYCIKGTPGSNPTCECDDSLGLLDGTSKVCVSTSVPYQDIGFLGMLGPDGFFGMLSDSGLGPITITTSHEERYYASR